MLPCSPVVGVLDIVLRKLSGNTDPGKQVPHEELGISVVAAALHACCCRRAISQSTAHIQQHHLHTLFQTAVYLCPASVKLASTHLAKLRLVALMAAMEHVEELGRQTPLLI